MQSSYKVISKDGSRPEQKVKKIFTNYTRKKNLPTKSGLRTNDTIITSYENLGKAILEDSNKKKEIIIAKAYEKAAEIEKHAYDNGYKKGYEKGMKAGKESGYKAAYDEGYKKNFDKAKQEGEMIKKNADNLLNSAVKEKKDYLKEKENQIKSLIVNAVENILKNEVKDKDSLNNVIFEALKQMRNTRTFIIKSRKKYSDELKNQIDIWKEQLPFKGDIFIITDESIDEGSVIVERDNGKMVLGIDIACRKLREILQDEE